ncbi:signal peptidase I [Fundicoccus sp. Sow4_D5]|uniref:signal peptidase I n=1 Tax=Fundicoccus sp. Sow4_D5 TaxID=3438782 RepID=UPI003F93A9B9
MQKILRVLDEYKLMFGLILFLLIARQFFFANFIVEGASMDYTLQDQNRVVGFQHFNIERFDVVIFNAPNEAKDYVKRVIGVPGDQIKYEGDQLYINNIAYAEPYLELKKEEYIHSFTNDFEVKEVIPEGYYFVLGDNRRNSTDSRELGLIEEADIYAELFFSYWPLDQMRVIR